MLLHNLCPAHALVLLSVWKASLATAHALLRGVLPKDQLPICLGLGQLEQAAVNLRRRSLLGPCLKAAWDCCQTLLVLPDGHLHLLLHNALDILRHGLLVGGGANARDGKVAKPAGLACGGILGNHMLGQLCVVHGKVLDQNVVGALQLGALQASAQQL